MNEIRRQLLSLADESYKRFHCKLMPTVPPERVIGVRVPVLRTLAKSLTPAQKQTLLADLPHSYYEENNLHAFVIEQIKDYDACMRAVDAFLPYVDNWATCDSMRPRVLGKHKTALFAKCEEWLASSHVYTVRYGIECLMLYGLDEAFDLSVLRRVAAVKSDEYYVNMMIAWFFATALTKRFDDTVWVLEKRELSPWTHNKTIQKAIESRVVTAEQKQYLKTLKISKEDLYYETVDMCGVGGRDTVDVDGV